MDGATARIAFAGMHPAFRTHAGLLRHLIVSRCLASICAINRGVIPGDAKEAVVARGRPQADKCTAMSKRPGRDARLVRIHAVLGPALGPVERQQVVAGLWLVFA